MLVGKEIGGSFKVERELGCGAMGTVYQAVYRETGQPVALKFIAQGLLNNETAVKRFEREANILKQLRHPNIVRLIAHGRYKKTPFIAMEYVDGESLDRILVRRGAFPWDEVVALGLQLCEALQYAHERGIIHRDLKPSNLMMLKDGTLKLTDFGIAKDTDVTSLTAENCTVGTASYMSPEQCRGERNLSAKSDLYSLGVMFYELLTGRKPFVTESPVDMFMKHVNEKPERPSRLALTIPVWLDTLVCQLLEKKPEHRPFDAAMVSKVLSEVEEKVASQRSAGMDAATTRAVDRANRRTDDTDRAAARTLREAAAKKKIRKKSVPLAERKWVQAAGLLGGLVVVAGLGIWFTRPASADQLYASARAALDAKDDRAVDKIERYLGRYGHLTDGRTQELRDARERLLVTRYERGLHNRFNREFKEADEGEKLGYQALRYENEGELADAERVWREMVERFRDESDPDLAVYPWLARKKLDDLARLPTQLARLRELLGQEHALVPPSPRPTLEPIERRCLEAYRCEAFGDQPAARDRWESIRKDNLKELAVRPWVLLAASRARSLKAVAVSGPEKEKEFRLELLKARLAAAESVPPDSDPNALRAAVAICRDVIVLYEKDPDPQVNTFAARARQKLRALGR